MDNIYLEITEGIVTNHWNYPEGVVPSGLVKAPTQYELGWTYDGTDFKPADDSIQARRVNLYANVEQQLDLLYWDMMNNTTHWQDSITAIKTEFPKE